MRLAPDDPPHEMHAEDAEPYLAEVAATAAIDSSHISALEAAIEASGRCELEQGDALKALLLHELYPEVPPEATEPILPECVSRLTSSEAASQCAASRRHLSARRSSSESSRRCRRSR